MPPANGLPTTERLALRRFTPDDLDVLHQLYSDPEVARYVGGTKTREQAQEMLDQRILAYYDAHPGLGVWMTLERASGACAGMHLLNNIQGETHIQLGYVLFKAYWGRGYATEMSMALLRHGFAAAGLEQIVAITDLANADSQHVLLKAGMQRKGERRFAHPAYRGESLAWFEADREDWLTRHDRAPRARAACRSDTTRGA